MASHDMFMDSTEWHWERVREVGMLSGPCLQFDLNEEIQKLQAEPRWQAGHTARTVAKYPDLRVVLVVMKAGARLERHHTAGRISIQTLMGTLRLHLPCEQVDLPTGTLLALDREIVHDVEALGDSAFLLSIAWPQPETVQVSAGVLRWWRKEEPLPVPEYQARPASFDQTRRQTFSGKEASSTAPNPVLTVS